MSGSKLTCSWWRGTEIDLLLEEQSKLTSFRCEIEIYVVLCGGSKLTSLHYRHRNLLGFCLVFVRVVEVGFD